MHNIVQALVFVMWSSYLQQQNTYPAHSEGPDCVVSQLLNLNQGDTNVLQSEATHLWPVLVTLGLQRIVTKSILNSPFLTKHKNVELSIPSELSLFKLSENDIRSRPTEQKLKQFKEFLCQYTTDTYMYERIIIEATFPVTDLLCSSLRRWWAWWCSTTSAPRPSSRSPG